MASRYLIEYVFHVNRSLYVLRINKDYVLTNLIKMSRTRIYAVHFLLSVVD